MDKIDAELLREIADLHAIPEGSYNIRKNGHSIGRASDAEIEIVPKTDRSGIDIRVKPFVRNKSVHIPVLITVGGLTDLVYNDFYIGEGADVTIIAGCGIHNDAAEQSRHDGVHTFRLERNSKVRYLEKHIGGGQGGGKILNPVTKIVMKSGSVFTMDTYQLGGVTSSDRRTDAVLYEGARLVVNEKILTDRDEWAKTRFKVRLKGAGSRVEVSSRSVARGRSSQAFVSDIVGDNDCFGHVSCDGILLDNAIITSVPKINARHAAASLIHEAAIGKIAGEQLMKLQTLGLNESEAESLIIQGFLA